MAITSEEVNLLVYRYLLESGMNRLGHVKCVTTLNRHRQWDSLLPPPQFKFNLFFFCAKSNYCENIFTISNRFLPFGLHICK
jgi:hypothetical protein